MQYILPDLMPYHWLIFLSSFIENFLASRWIEMTLAINFAAAVETVLY